MSTAPESTSYPSCTTLQYNGHEPSSNTVIFTVGPGSIWSQAATKTPQQVQQDAKNSGWLSVYNEWSWWYPWYRLHIVLNLNGAKVDAKFSPVLLGMPDVRFNFPYNFVPPIPINIDQGQASDIVYNVLVGSLSSVFGTMAVAVAAGEIPGGGELGLIIYGAALISVLGFAAYSYSSGNKLEALAMLAGDVVAGIGGTLAGLLSLSDMDAKSLIVGSIVFPILGIILSNLANSQNLVSSLVEGISTFLLALALGLIVLHFVPDPLTAYFYPAFIIISFAFAAAAYGLYKEWVSS